MHAIGIAPERFLFAGNATVTLKSKVSGQHFTYRVAQCEGKPSLYFLSVLNGQDNEANYQYAFCISCKDDDYVYYPTKGSKIRWDAPSVRAARWMLANMGTPKFQAQAELYHEGKCCRCGRKLTTPESIEAGIGPECAKR